MICPNCGRENRDKANFCRYCGTHFALACPRCRTVLPEDSLFCDNCGTALGQRPAASPHVAAPRSTPVAPPVTASAPAPAPGAPESEPVQSHLQQYIPRELLAKLEAARAKGEMVGERRVVTMLFSDIEGSTAAAEQLDPEDWGEIVNGAFERMIGPVYRYEGTLARLMGDAILAFFGAPIAHEDDPQRAVLAGLEIVTAIKPYREEIRKAWGIDLNVRVGINTGLVVVGAVGSDLRMEYTALGDAINLAKRMEQTAAPGTVQIAQDTYKLVKPVFEFEELGGVSVKGKSEPVLSYRVLGRKASGTRARGIEGLHADMVGREAEMRALHNVMSDLKQGVGRIVCILGEAGLGKTRLANETRLIFNELVGSDANWYETGSFAYEANQAYGLLQRLLRTVNGIAYNDPPSVVREKLAEVVTQLGPEGLPRAQQLFEALFGLESGNGGLPLESDSFKQELYEAIRGWWLARFSDRPTVLVFDDMHWSDAASIELLLKLLPLTAEIPLVLLCAMRSERQAPAWQVKTVADEQYQHRYTQLTLLPLSEGESDELLSRLLVNAELPERLRANILEKAAGNPFFLEEVVRTLIDRGLVTYGERIVNGSKQPYWRATTEGADFDIPANLQLLLSARLDRLEDGTRGTLQVASVIGRTFYRRVLQAVDEASSELDSHLGTLLQLQMIREAARVPEVEYAFRNPLTQEAVYKTILLKRRREFHRRVGEAMEGLYADRLEGMYGLLAHHYTLAGARDKAIEYSRLASRQAVAVFAYEDAAQNLHSALELVQPEEQSDLHIGLLEELGDVYRLLRDGGRAIAYFQQAFDLWHQRAGADSITGMRLNRKIVQVVTELKWSVSLEYLQQSQQSRVAALQGLQKALEAMEGERAHPEVVRALVVLSTDAWRIQEPPDWEAAHRYAQEAVEMAEKLDSPVELSQALGALANVLDGRSLLREHLRVAERRLALCTERRFDDIGERIEAYRCAGAARMYVGEYQEALSFLQEAEALAARAHIVEQQANAVGIQSQCYFRLDRWDDVLATEAKWRDLERRYSRERVGETCFFVALSASVHALRGSFDKANLYAKEAYEYMVSMSGDTEHWQRNQFY